MNKYTKEQIDFILQLAPYKTAREISDLFYEKYNIRISNGYINQIRFKNKIKLDYYESKINDSQRKWLLNMLPYHDNKEAIELFKNKFGIELTNSMLKNIRHNYNVKRVYKQKIKDMRFREKIRKPLYNEVRLDNKDYIRVETRKYQHKRRYVWEQYYGRKIPKDYVVIFLNEKNNYDINNLALVKKGTLSYCCNKGIELNDKNIIKTIDMIRLLDKKAKNKMEVYYE